MKSIILLYSILRYFLIAVICLTTHPARSLADFCSAKVQDFSCTNVPISKAIYQLSKSAHYPIDAIIDTDSEPLTTVSGKDEDLTNMLSEIVKTLPDYIIIQKTGVLLVLPRKLQYDELFPLNRPLMSIKITCAKTGAETNFGCHFETEPSLGSLNVCLPFTTFYGIKPKIAYHETSQLYTNQSLLQVLLTLSSDINQSWLCGRIRPAFINKYNARLKSRGVSSTWWENGGAPGYSIKWDDGPFLGEYMGYTLKKDEQGHLYKEYITWEEVERKESASRIEVDRFLRCKVVNDLLVRGMKNKEVSPVQLRVTINSQISNSIAIALLSLTITNKTDSLETIPNPYNSVLQQAFWDVRIYMSRDVEPQFKSMQYRIELPSVSRKSEEHEIVLSPHASATRTFNIIGAKMERDAMYTSASIPGKLLDELVCPGKYTIVVRMYFKDLTGKEHCLNSDPMDFEIRE